MSIIDILLNPYMAGLLIVGLLIISTFLLDVYFNRDNEK